MSNTTLKSAGLVIIIIVLAGISQAVMVDGYCYLENQTNHEGTKVLFEGDSPGAVTDSTYTNSSGYYQIDLAAGFYHIFFTHQGYASARILSQNCFSPITLPDVSLAAQLSGPLSGVLGAGTYVINGDISIQSGDSLTIMPGTNLLFDGNYSFTISGYLYAVGNESDSIKFIPYTPGPGWGGIHFDDLASDLAEIQYTRISGGTNGISCISSSPRISFCTISGNFGYGIRLTSSSVNIRNNTISENTGDGIYCFSSSNFNITDNIITGNSNRGITCGASNPTITGNTIESNSGGGIVCLSGSEPTIMYNQIHYNTTPQEGGGISCIDSNPIIQNNSIQYNTIDAESNHSASGGGLYLENCILSNLISDNEIRYNQLSSGSGSMHDSRGGGICAINCSLTISNNEILQNNAYAAGNQQTVEAHGGGIYCQNLTGEISHNIISANIASAGSSVWYSTVRGGGISCLNSTITINGNTVSSNEAYESSFWSFDHANGGGIFLEMSTVDLYDNDIFGNIVGVGWPYDKGDGGGIMCSGLDGTTVIHHNAIYNNSGEQGGGIYCTDCDHTITYNSIYDNTATYGGGGIYCNYSQMQISNNTIASNTGGSSGGLILSSSPSTVLNCIFSENTAGISFINSANASITFCDFNNNSFFGQGPSYIGQIVTVNLNGDSCDIYYNIFEDPLFVDPGNNNFNLQSNSTCIDAGDPNSRYDPDGTIADIGTFYYDQGANPNIEVSSDSLMFSLVPVRYDEELPLTLYNTGSDTLVIYDIYTSEPSFSTDYNSADSLIAPGDSLPVTAIFTPAEIGNYSELLTIENSDVPVIVTLDGKGVGPVAINLYPYDPPIIIPAGGGSFDYAITIDNRTPDTQVFDLWLEIILPDSQVIPVLNRLDIAIPGDFATQRDLTQVVPDYAPAGIYYYFAYAGNYPDIVQDQGWFTFEKEGGNGGYLGSPSDWICSSEGFDNIGIGRRQAVTLPEEYALHNAYPNPFNPTTTIRFDLPEACWVKLEVFEIGGRQVEMSGSGTIPTTGLAAGWREAGSHEVTFDGSKLSSGMYFYRIQAGEFVEVRKMVLLK